MKLTIIYIIILAIGSILPINGTDSALNNAYILNIRLDYIVHGLIFIPLYPLLATGFNKGNKEENTHKYFNAKALIYALLIAILIEGIQYFVPYRTFNVNDVVGNFIGVGVGIIILVGIQSKRKNNKAIC